MGERVKVTLDFTGCKYIGELFQKMRTKMEWDDDLGENLNALWDILWGMLENLSHRKQVYRATTVCI